MRAGLCAAALAMAAGFVMSAQAATISTLSGGNIRIVGKIVQGDEVDFAAKLAIGSGRPIEVYLDSPGGFVPTGVKLAEIVHAAGLKTHVPYRGECYSACVLIFAAGTERIANAESMIGVHSAGVPDEASAEGGLKENGETLATTALMARVMAVYGAPHSVIGKMVATPTKEMTVLTLADLEAWDVRISRNGPAQEATARLPQTSVTVPVAPPVVIQLSPQPSPGPVGLSENVRRVVATFGAEPWDNKVAYMRDKGARFERICPRARCYFESSYTGDWATITLSWTDGLAGRPVRQIWCVSDPSAWVRTCYDQNGRGGYVQRYDGAEWHRS